MINVYLNYPNSAATLHQTKDCPRIQQHHSVNQRIVKINPETIQTELEKFMNGEVPFRAEASANDMWLEIDFDDLEFEIETAKFVLRQLGKRYAAFDSLTPDIHC
jgi:hypothetical protein